MKLQILYELKDPRTNWKYILIVLILALLVSGGILDYSKYVINELTSFSRFLEIKKPERVIKDETANWRIYRNEKYRFEVKYPNDWLVEEVRGSSDKLLYILFYPSTGEGVITYPIQLLIYENFEELPIKEWIEEKSGSVILGIREISEITVNGEQAIKLVESGRIRLSNGGLTKEWFEKDSVYIEHGSLIYNLTTIIDHKYFNNMLSTFRFLK